MNDPITAFPLGTREGYYLGISLRDYFAIHSLQGMIATAAAPCLTGFQNAEEPMAKAAYIMADAMLKARGDQS